MVSGGRLDYEMLVQTNNKVPERGRPEQQAESKVLTVGGQWLWRQTIGQ